MHTQNIVLCTFRTQGSEPPMIEGGKGHSMYGFPCGMDVDLNLFDYSHNGWLTVKRKVMEEIPYPIDRPKGQDNLFPWRIVTRNYTYNQINAKLGLYMHNESTPIQPHINITYPVPAL